MYLQKKASQLYLVDNFSRSARDDAWLALLAKPNVQEFCIDLCDAKAVAALPLDVDYVYHLAAMNGTQNFYDRPFDVLKNSTLPTIHLLEHFSQSKALRRFVYAGSSEAYASTVTLFDWVVPTAEDVPLSIADPTNVRWSYGGSKLHGELATVAASAQFGIPYTVVRFHNVYGSRMGDKHVIPDFLDRASKGTYELFGYEDTRSFIYIDDAVRATVEVAEAPATKNEVINVGGEPEISMLDLGKLMMKALGKEGEITCHPSPKGSVRRRAPDLGKLHRLTSYRQEVSLEEGLRKVVGVLLANV